VATVLIVNPWASGVDEERLAAVQAALPDAVLRMTSRQGEATELTRDVAGQVDAIYVFGGDGTYNEVLNGVDRETPLGFVPGGGASVLPRALGLPRDAVAAAQQLSVATPRRIGLGRVNGHRFGFAAGLGLDAELVRAVDDLGRNPDGKRPGDFAFAWSGVRVLWRHGFSLDPVLEVKGHGRSAFALVSNGPTYTYAGRIPLRPASQATFEGGLDLVGPTKIRARRLPRILRYAVSGMDRAKPDDVVYVHDADRLEVLCDVPLPLQADGEDLGDVDSAVFEAERDAVTVLT